MKRARRTPETIAAELDARERVLLFCLGSGTSPVRAGVGNTATLRSRLIVRGVIERDGSRFVVDLGRAVLTAVLAAGPRGAGS